MTISIKSAEQSPIAIQGRRTVPWGTVVPLAILMSYADGFWMVSLRGAVGAIERTQGPFASWFREASIVLPVFVAAVLGALTVAVRLFGPVLRKGRTVVATALLITVAGTVVGIAEVAASAAYDYHLQASQLQLMNAMHGSCTGNCLAQQLHSTLDIQIRAVGYASKLILITNVVLVFWVVALWGGRLNVSVTSRLRHPSANAHHATGDQAPVHRDRPEPVAEWAQRAEFDLGADGRPRDLRMLLIAGLIGSATLHTAVGPDQRSEWTLAGVFFMLLTAAEVLLACMLLLRPQRKVLLAAAVVSGGPLVLWLCSRTAGLPFGPHAGVPYAVGLPDIVASALAAGTLLAAVVLLHSTGRLLAGPAASVHVRTMAFVAVTAVTLIGLAGTHLSWFGDYASPGSHPTTITHH